MLESRVHRTRRGGLTLVELLVVIAVIGILIGLLLPAVMSARSSGRRSQCANNLRQLGAAVQQFHQRHGALPPYWGGMRNAGGEMFGPWIMHVLPDLGEQAFYDRFQPSVSGSVEIITWSQGAKLTDEVPESTNPKYRPPVYTTSTTAVRTYSFNGIGWTISGTVNEVTATLTDPGEGNPFIAATFEQIPTSTFPLISSGLHRDFDVAQSAKSLDVLQCSDDASGVAPNTMQRTASGTSRGNVSWSLTNYMANAHVFMRFSPPSSLPAGVSSVGGRIISGTDRNPLDANMGGRFPRASGARAVGVSPPTFHHGVSGTVGLSPRQFAHIVDGLSNTIMFGEGMRRCDDGNSTRYAFLPTNERGDEHSFGIDVSVTGTMASPTASSTLWLPQWGNVDMAFGNTLMFQQRPPPSGCNKYRLQANHEVLNVAMCDGSVRGISPRVTRREQCDPDVAGREYGRDTYNPIGLGSVQGSSFADGIWDMLMVPNDPPGNVLANTGEIGKEE